MPCAGSKSRVDESGCWGSQTGVGARRLWDQRPRARACAGTLSTLPWPCVGPIQLSAGQVQVVLVLLHHAACKPCSGLGAP